MDIHSAADSNDSQKQSADGMNHGGGGLEIQPEPGGRGKYTLHPSSSSTLQFYHRLAS